MRLSRLRRAGRRPRAGRSRRRGRSKARLEGHAGVGNRLEGPLCGRGLELRKGIRVARIGDEMRVAVDQAGQHRVAGQIDDRRVRRDRDRGPDGLDPSVLDQDHRVRHDRARLHVDEPSGLDGDAVPAAADPRRQRSRRRRTSRGVRRTLASCDGLSRKRAESTVILCRISRVQTLAARFAGRPTRDGKFASVPRPRKLT